MPACSGCPSTLAAIEDALRTRARQAMESRIVPTEDLEEAKRRLNAEGGIVEVPWCGEAACGQGIEAAVDARVLGVPFDAGDRVAGTCPACGAPGGHWVRVARTY